MPPCPLPTSTCTNMLLHVFTDAHTCTSADLHMCPDTCAYACTTRIQTFMPSRTQNLSPRAPPKNLIQDLRDCDLEAFTAWRLEKDPASGGDWFGPGETKAEQDLILDKQGPSHKQSAGQLRVGAGSLSQPNYLSVCCSCYLIF